MIYCRFLTVSARAWPGYEMVVVSLLGLAIQSHLWNTISIIISPSGIYWSGAELLKTSREATHIPTFPWLAGIRWATQDNQIISNHCNSFAKSAGPLFSCIYFHATGKLNPKHTLENLHSPSLLVIFILTSLSTVLSKMTACAVI